MKRQITSTIVALFIGGSALTIPAVIVHASQRQKTEEGIGRKTADTLKSGFDKSVSATEKGFEKTGEALSKAGDEVTDIWILTAVKTNLAGESLLRGINVDCDQHVVTLRGTVRTEVWHTRAVEIAQKTRGVHGVVDELTVGPKS